MYSINIYPYLSPFHTTSIILGMGKYQPFFIGNGGVKKFMKTTFIMDILFWLSNSGILSSVVFIIFGGQTLRIIGPQWFTPPIHDLVQSPPLGYGLDTVTWPSDQQSC